MAKTADRLLEGVKRRAIAPAAQTLMSNDDILALADDVTEELMVPLLMAARQDFFITSEDQTITSGTDSYDIPYRAIGRGLRDLKLVDSDSNKRDLTLISPEDAHLFPTGTIPHSFYFKGDKIILVPSPTTSGLSLEIWYSRKPSRLCVLADAAIASTVGATDVVTTAEPDTITSGTVVDFIQARQGNQVLAVDKTVTTVASTTYTFAASTIPSAFAAADYISVAFTTPVVQLPDECYPSLETATAMRLLAALGDYEAANMLEKQLTEEVKRLKMIIEPRVIGESTIIINRSGLLRGSRTRMRRGMYGGSV
jgi:hypothetical protein